MHVVLLKEEAKVDAYREVLTAVGCMVDFVPMLEITAVGGEGVEKARTSYAAYSAVVCTSKNASNVLATWVAAGPPPRAVFAVGAKTAAPLEAAGLAVHGTEAGSAARLAPIVVEFVRHSEKPHRVLFLCGASRLRDLPTALSAAEVDVDEVVVYESSAIAARLQDRLPPLGDRPTALVHFAPSSARAAVAGLDDVSRFRHVAIGESTAAALRGGGVEGVAVAKTPTPQGVAAAVF